MKRVLVLWGLALLAFSLFGACGVDQTGTAGSDAGGAGGSYDGGGGVAGGVCFPGSKVCPVNGEPTCLPSNDPEMGCGTPSCDPCPLPNAKAECDSTFECAIADCNDGFKNCNTDKVDGCEVDLNTDYYNCGDCGIDCIATRGKNWTCTNGICTVTICNDVTVEANCDGNDANGCEVNITSDPNNCAGCGIVCNLEHAFNGCAASSCVVTGCEAPYENCDGVHANGCETNTSNNFDNCGGCGVQCKNINGIAGCLLGNCVIVCTPPFDNCNLDALDGCEINLDTNPSHCGGCGNACNPQNANAATCTNGQCGYDSCNPGFGDCDGNVANGCETNLLTSVGNCGVCANACNPASGGSAVCNNGTCAQTCSGGLQLCNGTCVNYNNNVNNCGGCNQACTSNPPNSQPVCNSGACGFNCNSGYAKCGSTTQCYNLSNDIQHCGSCPNACTPPANSTATCNSGTCGFNCNTNYTKCTNNCYNLQTDKSHCGTCTTVCTNPQNGVNNCVSGGCSITCNGGFDLCGNECVNFQTDPAHCGDCSTVCSAPTTSCKTGNCECPVAGEENCSGTCTNTQTDPNNCNNCGSGCSDGPANSHKTCTAGVCGWACDAGYTGCPTASPTSCKNLLNDDNNCGTCGNKCTGTTTCNNGSCT